MKWLVALVILGLADIIATHYQIALFGVDVEANPIQKWIMTNIGMWGSYVFRILCPVLGVSILLKIRENEPQWTGFINFWLWLALIVNIGVMVWHVYLTDFFTLHLNRG